VYSRRSVCNRAAAVVVAAAAADTDDDAVVFVDESLAIKLLSILIVENVFVLAFSMCIPVYIEIT